MKVNNWQTILQQELDKYENIPFKWGKNDCCLFSANILNVITGNDYAQEFRGMYSTKYGAYKLLKKKGYENLFSIPKIKLGFPRKNVTDYQYGDLMLSEFNGNQALGICVGVRSYFVTDEGKYCKILSKDCLYCWEIK